MAAPNVVNLAAKLFALDSKLTPAQAIDLVRRGASASEDGRRHLIDEKRSVALLKAERAAASFPPFTTKNQSTKKSGMKFLVPGVTEYFSRSVMPCEASTLSSI